MYGLGLAQWVLSVVREEWSVLVRQKPELRGREWVEDGEFVADCWETRESVTGGKASYKTKLLLEIRINTTTD